MLLRENVVELQAAHAPHKGVLSKQLLLNNAKQSLFGIVNKYYVKNRNITYQISVGALSNSYENLAVSVNFDTPLDAGCVVANWSENGQTKEGLSGPR